MGAEYRLDRDAWALDWTTTYFHSRSARANSQRVPRTRYLQGGPVATWRHDLTENWASELHVGFGVGYWIDAHAPLTEFPVWGGALQWRRDDYGATLSYTGEVAPNLVTNQLYFSDTVALTGTWGLIPEQNLALFSSHALAMHREVVAPGNPTVPALFVWTSAAGLSWSPERLPQVTLAYQHTEQFGARETSQAPSFYRNQVMLSIRGRFPELDLGHIRGSGSLRVDRAHPEAGTRGSDPEDSGGHASSNESPRADASETVR